jgi:hypothetical protein
MIFVDAVSEHIKCRFDLNIGPNKWSSSLVILSHGAERATVTDMLGFSLSFSLHICILRYVLIT